MLAESRQIINELNMTITTHKEEIVVLEKRIVEFEAKITSIKQTLHVSQQNEVRGSFDFKEDTKHPQMIRKHPQMSATKLAVFRLSNLFHVHSPNGKQTPPVPLIQVIPGRCF